MPDFGFLDLDVVGVAEKEKMTGANWSQVGYSARSGMVEKNFVFRTTGEHRLTRIFSS
jgi:hypothetical protein